MTRRAPLFYYAKGPKSFSFMILLMQIWVKLPEYSLHLLRHACAKALRGHICRSITRTVADEFKDCYWGRIVHLLCFPSGITNLHWNSNFRLPHKEQRWKAQSQKSLCDPTMRVWVNEEMENVDHFLLQCSKYTDNYFLKWLGIV